MKSYCNEQIYNIESFKRIFIYIMHVIYIRFIMLISKIIAAKRAKNYCSSFIFCFYSIFPADTNSEKKKGIEQAVSQHISINVRLSCSLFYSPTFSKIKEQCQISHGGLKMALYWDICHLVEGFISKEQYRL